MKYVLRRPRSSTSALLLFAALATCFAVAAPAARAVKPAHRPRACHGCRGHRTALRQCGDPRPRDLKLNGEPIGVGTDGCFTANVDLQRKTTVALSYRNPQTGLVTSLSIPIVELAGLNLPTLPSTIDGGPVAFAGQVLNGDQLAGLQVNGVEVLDLVPPGGLLSIPLAEGLREVTTLLTDTIETPPTAPSASSSSSPRRVVGPRVSA
jgi:hypothetical protein